MNRKALHILEYDKMIDRLTACAGSPLGKELCRNLQPSSDLSEIRAMQEETTLAVGRIFQKGSLSFSGVADIRGSLKRLEVGGVLSPHDLLQVCKTLEVCARVKGYARKGREDSAMASLFRQGNRTGNRRMEKEHRHTPGSRTAGQTGGTDDAETMTDILDPMFEALQPLSPLANEIRRCFPSEEEISDDASPNLRRIRRQMQQVNDRVHAQLNSMVNGSARTYLQDAVITMRDGRYCLPVRSEYRNQVQGMIHDQSATGSTFFIEPMAVIKLNNELRELELEEEKEIEAILANLSSRAAGDLESLQTDLTLLTRLDFIFARAQLSRSYNGSEPVFNEEGRIVIKKGRHPLLDPKKAVPIDLRLGQEFDLLIITGPNTGGKTVSLKTVGLFTLLGQSGLHIPAFDRSELAVFDDVFADIGDEQSIEQSLSTFSSHMTNIVRILNQATPRSLVLFDELCAGTDPTEGAALAISILSRLHRQGVRTIATTHYSELKVFALSADGVENGCCEFNVETLCPTYRLLIGIPGKSNAFAISSRLGLPEEIIDEAREQLSEQDTDFETLISDLETSRVTIEKEQEEIDRYKTEIQQLKSRLEHKQESLDASREKILRDAHEQAHAILREAKEYADTTIRNFNKFGKAGIDSRAMEQERSRLREKMSGEEQHLALKPEKKRSKQLQAKDLHIGDSVRVLSMNLKGTVSTLPNAKGDLFVQMGILRSQVNLNDLELIMDTETLKPGSRKSGVSHIKVSKSASVSTEINLLGKTTDEAISMLDKYLDDAYLSHLPSVRVVHGKGTGALRKAVHNYLRKQKHVESYRLGEFGEGDSGVTIVTFRK